MPLIQLVSAGTYESKTETSEVVKAKFKKKKTSEVVVVYTNCYGNESSLEADCTGLICAMQPIWICGPRWKEISM